MKKVLLIVFVAVAIMALMGTTAFACGEKKTDAENAGTDKNAKVQTTDSKAKVCPVAGAAKVCDAAKTAKSAEASAEDDKSSTRTLSIKGMTCTGCENTISAALAEVPGVVEVVKVCHKSGQAIVRVDPTGADDELLTKAVVNKGYEAEIIPAVVKTTEAAPKGKVCPLIGGPGCDEKTSKASDEKKTEEAK